MVEIKGRALANMSKDDSSRLGLAQAHISNLEDTALTDYISDGQHTFGDLYFHRMCLTKIIAYVVTTEDAMLVGTRHRVYRSTKHSDDSMFDGYFIVVFKTPEGDYSYHYEMKYWDMFDFLPTHDRADEYDGHTPDDISRLDSLFMSGKYL